MDKSFIISVVLPVYNIEKYLETAVESIIGQTLGFADNIQIVFVNDGSTDRTGEICHEYMSRYPDNIKYIEQENRGVSAALNAGKNCADGKYICFFGGDDRWSLDSFARMVFFFDTHYDEIDFVSAKIKIFGDQEYEHPLNYKYEMTRIIDLEKEPSLIQTTTGNNIYKASAVKNLYFDENVRIHEDILFNTILLMDKKKYGVCSDALSYYRKHSDGSSLSSNIREKKYWFIDIPEQVYIPLIERSLSLFDCVIPFVQEVLIYGIKWRLRTPLPHDLLSDDEIERFLSNIKFVVKHIDDNRIMDAKSVAILYKAHLLGFKYGENAFENADLTPEGKLIYRNFVIFDYEGRGTAKITDVFEEKKRINIRGELRCVFPRFECGARVIDDRGNEIEAEIRRNPDLNIISFDGKKIADGVGISFIMHRRSKSSAFIALKVQGIERTIIAKLSRSNRLVKDKQKNIEYLDIRNSKKHTLLLKNKKEISICK